MSTVIQSLLKQLADTDSGWVNRRDAADSLGKVAQGAIEGLKTHEKDSDQDVKTAVHNSLRTIGLAMTGVDLSTVPGSLPSLEKMLHALEAPGRRDLTKLREGFSMKVVVKGGRTQTVLIEESISNTEMAVIRVSTVCAKADASSYEWALKNNPRMSHCALGVEDRDGESMLVLMNNLLADSLSFAELKLSVKEVAFYGDWIEEKLTGEDVH